MNSNIREILHALHSLTPTYRALTWGRSTLSTLRAVFSSTAMISVSVPSSSTKTCVQASPTCLASAARRSRNVGLVGLALPQNPRVPLDRVIVPPNRSVSGSRASSSDGLPPDPGSYLQDEKTQALSNSARCPSVAARRRGSSAGLSLEAHPTTVQALNGHEG
jgi:hypothetical protein